MDNTNVSVLAQLFPAAAVETLLFSVPLANRAFFQGLTVCNHGAADTFRVSISLQGAATTAKDYIFFDNPLGANNTLLVELDVTMGAKDAVRVVSTNGTCSFIMYGALV